jgi:hypothetical protein
MTYTHEDLPNLMIRESHGGRYEGRSTPHVGLTLVIDTFARSRIVPGLITMMVGRGLLEQPEGDPTGDHADGQGPYSA